MGLQGSLQDMHIADLIQHNCQDEKSVKVLIQSSGKEAVLFFDGGQVIHAELEGKRGEEVVYEILQWSEGSFSMEAGIQAPVKTITRSWSGLLLEGARRLDENETQTTMPQTEININMEVDQMAQNFNEILEEMSHEINGYIGSALVGMDGMNLAFHTKGKEDEEIISAQTTLLFKLVDGALSKLGLGDVEDNLTTTETSYILERFLPGKNYYLRVSTDRKTGQLGNMRLMCKIYTERLAKAMPR